MPDHLNVMPKAVADRLIQQSGGDVRRLEDLLGLNRGDLGTGPVRVDIQSPSGLRVPSGNELGANNQWVPGGFTSGGIPEATIDPSCLVSTRSRQFSSKRENKWLKSYSRDMGVRLCSEETYSS